MAFADKIPPQYLWCRDMAHAWDPASLVSREVFNRHTERWEIWRTVACLNCPSHKTQKLTKSYQILRTDYDKPPDYSITGDPRITAKDRAQIRARSTALRGGVERTDRKATRKTGNIRSIRTGRRRA